MTSGLYIDMTSSPTMIFPKHFTVASSENTENCLWNLNLLIHLLCVLQKSKKTDLSQQSPKSNRSREMAKQITITSAAIFWIKRYYARIARQMTANEFINCLSRPKVASSDPFVRRWIKECLSAASDNQSVVKNTWKGDQRSTNRWVTGITLSKSGSCLHRYKPTGGLISSV